MFLVLVHVPRQVMGLKLELTVSPMVSRVSTFCSDDELAHHHGNALLLWS